MAHTIDVNELDFGDYANGNKRFIMQKIQRKVVKGDTVVLQYEDVEEHFTVTSIATPDEDNGLKSGWQALTIKPKEA